MRIAAIVHQAPPRFQGGTEILALRSMEGLTRRGHDATVFAADPTAPVEDMERSHESNGALVVEIGARQRAEPGLAARIKREYAHPLLAAALIRHLTALRPELIHVHHFLQFGIGIAPALARIAPLVFSATDFHLACPLVTAMLPDGYACTGPNPGMENCLQHYRAALAAEQRGAHGLRARLSAHAHGLAGLMLRADAEAGLKRVMRGREAAMRAAFGACEVILAGTGAMRDFLLRAGAPSSRVRVLAPATPPVLAPPPPAGPKLSVGFLGTLAPHKGAHVFAAAVHMIPHAAPVHFTLRGDATAAPAYARGVLRQLGADRRVKILPPVPDSHFGEALAGLDIVVAPALWTENAPLTVTAALETGRFVIASDVPGLAYAAEDLRGGMLVPKDDPAALAEAIMGLARQRKRLEGLGATPVRQSGFDAYLDTLESVYHEAIAA